MFMFSNTLRFQTPWSPLMLSPPSIVLHDFWMGCQRTSVGKLFDTAPSKGGNFPLKILALQTLNMMQSNLLSSQKPRPTKLWQFTTANGHSENEPVLRSAMPSVKIHPAKLQPPPQLCPLRLHQQKHLRHPVWTPALRN